MVRTEKLRRNDRILVLEKTDPEAKDIGLIDPKTLEGKNPLHVVLDTSNLMWTFKYEHGVIPPVLRAKFTSFAQAKAHAEQYFSTKKIRIVDVKD